MLILVIGGAGTIGSYIYQGSTEVSSCLNYLLLTLTRMVLPELTRTLRSDSNIMVPESYLTYPMSFNSDVFYKMLE